MCFLQLRCSLNGNFLFYSVLIAYELLLVGRLTAKVPGSCTAMTVPANETRYSMVALVTPSLAN